MDMLPPIPLTEMIREYPKETLQSSIPYEEIVQCQRLQAHANNIWKITTASKKEYIFRNLIKTHNFAKELAISTFAASIGISPVIVNSDENAFWLLLEYIPFEAWPLFKENAAPYFDAMKNLWDFHHLGSLYFSQTRGHTSFQPFTFILKEGDRLSKNEKLPCQFTIALERVQKIFHHLKPWIEKNAMFCHGDFHHGNALLSDKRVYLIDWETCNWGDPLFDVVKFSCRLKNEERMLLYQSYLQREPTLSELAHFELIDLAFLMVVSVNRLKRLTNQKSLQQLTKQEAEELLEQDSLPSYLTIPYADEFAYLSALAEFLKRTQTDQLNHLLNSFNG